MGPALPRSTAATSVPPTGPSGSRISGAGWWHASRYCTMHCALRAYFTGQGRRPGRSVDGDDLVGLVARDELVAGFRDVQHLFEAHAELVELAVLGFECERHTGLDLDRMVQ